MSRIQRAYPILVFLSITAMGWAADSTITIQVYSEVALSDKVLSQAEGEGMRIFQRAKVSTVWVNCDAFLASTDSRCHEAPDRKHLVLRIVPKALGGAESIFGVAFLAENGGVYADVFFDSIATLHRDCGASIGRVLGHVMAHEVGHLLLGSNSHSSVGIMSPKWHREQLLRVGMGTLFFSSEDTRTMRGNISNLEPSFARKESVDEASRLGSKPSK
ncbi:MAG TPA: hypothetical protein VGS27_25500 [Candidatus Sulfotelmatobacter sp.]|nr:hypothetical protein [Candidatus Sulfotelmatobacter sp.]